MEDTTILIRAQELYKKKPEDLRRAPAQERKKFKYVKDVINRWTDTKETESVILKRQERINNLLEIKEQIEDLYNEFLYLCIKRKAIKKFILLRNDIFFDMYRKIIKKVGIQKARTLFIKRLCLFGVFKVEKRNKDLVEIKVLKPL